MYLFKLVKNKTMNHLGLSLSGSVSINNTTIDKKLNLTVVSNIFTTVDERSSSLGDYRPSTSLKLLTLRHESGEKRFSLRRSRPHSLGIWLAALARRTAPGLGYGRCWNRGPDAVVSAPVLASLCLGKPLDQVPLQGQSFCSGPRDVCRSRKWE